MSIKTYDFMQSGTGDKYTVEFDEDSVKTYGFTTVSRFIERCCSLVVGVSSMPQGSGDAFVENVEGHLCVSVVSDVQSTDNGFRARLFYSDRLGSETVAVLDIVLELKRV